MFNTHTHWDFVVETRECIPMPVTPAPSPWSDVAVAASLNLVAGGVSLNVGVAACLLSDTWPDGIGRICD